MLSDWHPIDSDVAANRLNRYDLAALLLQFWWLLAVVWVMFAVFLLWV
jgi:hypothetical protein